MYTKVCRNVGHILYASCIHFVYINSDLQKVYIIRSVYMQFVYKIHTKCIQIIASKMYPTF